MLKAKTMKQVMFNSYCDQGVLSDRLQQSFKRPHDVRRVVGEVNDRKQKAKAEQHMASEVVNLVENLHDTTETEGVCTSTT